MAADPLDPAFSATIPNDLLDPPQFGQQVETTKDAIVLELRNFFNNSAITYARRTEIPTIEKYSIPNDGYDGLSTAVSIVQKYPDVLEHLPLISVMAANATERKLMVARPIIAVVANPSTLTALNAEPYALNDGDQLVVRVHPAQNHPPIFETITFTANRFPTGNPIGSALATDVARVVNEQSQYLTAVVATSGSTNYVRLQAGGPRGYQEARLPLSIEVSPASVHADAILGVKQSGTSMSLTPAYPITQLVSAASTFASSLVGNYINIANADLPYFNNGRFEITAVSTDGSTISYANRYGQAESTGHATWYIGQRDTFLNPNNVPKNRYAMSSDMEVGIDIICSDENTRNELSDLVNSFFGFFAEEKYFTFMGRSWFPSATTQTEFYQIFINSPIRLSGESELARPGDSVGKIYTNNLSMSVSTTWFLDRDLYFPGSNDTIPFITTKNTLVEDNTIPIVGEED